MESPRTNIDKLPEDVLIEIFSCYRLLHMSHRTYWPWHMLTHVCRRWRQLVIASPNRLKLRLKVTRNSPVSVILAYSPPLPLALVYVTQPGDPETPDSPSWPSATVDEITLAFEHINRVRSICLCSTCEALESQLLPLMTWPALQLEILIIQSDIPVLLSSNSLLGGRAPVLREVMFTNVILDSAIAPFPQAPCVTSFWFWLEEADSVGSSLTRSLTEALCAMPSLESLFLTLPIDLLDPEELPARNIGRTSFPALSSILYRGPSGHFDYLIQRIDVPQLVTLQIHLYGISLFAIPSLSRFISGAPKLLVPSSARMELSVSTSYLQLVPLVLSRASIVLYIDFGAPLPHPSLIASTASVFRSLIPALSLSTSLSIKDIGGPDDISPGRNREDDARDLFTVFRAFEQVTSLHVDNASTPYICHALLESTSRKLLPNLQEVELAFYSHDGYSPSDALVRLEPFIADRKFTGRPVKVYCTILPQGKKHPALKDVCGLIWDIRSKTKIELNV
ncbi:hypothetical protein BC834DRAFT_1045592 [Gloeopeniophorella convolvens]|nr:hypothetical protein BC834DRAFT_1045592 [Gloeopeniophorella convolvens]